MTSKKINISAIGDPWAVNIKYPAVPAFPSFPKNKKEIDARTKGIAAYRQTFSWLGDGLLRTPQLVLGYKMDYAYLNRVEDYKLKVAHVKPWRRIAHQHSGVLCSHTYMLARKLTPRPEFLECMRNIVAMNNSVSGWSPSLSQVVRYRDSLRTLCPHIKLSCEETYQDLAEAIFPLDLDEATLKQMCTDKLPAFSNWAKQFVAENALMDLYKAPHYMRLFIFGENSD